MKIATTEDIPEITNMAMDFLEVSGYADLGNEKTITKLITDVVTSSQTEKIILLKPDIGFIAGIATPFLFGDCLLATEIAWWVNPDSRGSGEGLKLLGAFEYWAKHVAECKLISMSSLDKEIEKYYKKNGYKLYERAYMKVL
jgi:hypothetical protein